MEEQKRIQIIEMKKEGMRISEIAEATGVSANTIKSLLRRLEATDDAGSAEVCRHCGRGLTHVPGKKKKEFCSSKCRYAFAYQKCLRKARTAVCANCNVEFTYQGKQRRKYCCTQCYMAARYGGVAQ